MQEVCAAGFRHVPHDAVEPVFGRQAGLPAVNVLDRSLERPFDQPVRGIDVSEQKARRKPQFGQKRKHVVRRIWRGAGHPARRLRREKGIEYSLAARGLSQIAGIAKMLGNGDIAIAAKEHERHAATHQLVGDRKYPTAIEIDVEDCSLRRLGVNGCLFDRRRGTKYDSAHIAEISRKIACQHPFVLDDQNMHTPEIVHLVILSSIGI
ncbi:hypothetical protein [Mesorhizobium sp. M0587]|uniref:hypothetical protein n=1 Tax=Mesorhizobium sp. M0587 TaxID=2956964 RepID=UPI003334E350